MGIFDRMTEPVFLKESSNAEEQLIKLREMEPLLNKKGKTILRQDIKNLEYGIGGEKNIAFELKNCHMPMYILHDIYLESGGLSAQIDYLVFTKKLCFVIECKNLYGNLEINNRGEFIRTIDLDGRKKREGIYSPVTQNQRHLELMKKIIMENKSNAFSRYLVGRGFEDFYRLVVVLANPKTVLNAKYAVKEIKEKVIRADQLVKYIKDSYDQSKASVDSDKNMLAWAQSYLKLHQDIVKDYTAKYELYKKEEGALTEAVPIPPEPILRTAEVQAALEDTDIFKELRAYRLEKSREEKLKPYYICNDNQLKELIARMPADQEELKAVPGFGEVKIRKYGEDILRIVKKYS